ncbi:MAG: hypothetical protein GY708_28330 [Actinomycetia bacterium]|nr:hypothetical protein [Actinomycetes bacterium]
MCGFGGDGWHRPEEACVTEREDATVLSENDIAVPAGCCREGDGRAVERDVSQIAVVCCGSVRRDLTVRTQHPETIAIDGGGKGDSGRRRRRSVAEVGCSTQLVDGA